MRHPDFIAKTLLVNPEDQALIMTRAEDDEDRPGEADLVGGGREVDRRMTGGTEQVDFLETVTACAVREIADESGFHVDPNDMYLLYADTRMSRKDTLSVVRFLFGTRVFSGEFRSSPEHSNENAVWVDLPNVPHVLAHPVWSQAVQYALDNHQI